MIYKNKHGRVILTSSDLDLPEFNYKNIQAGEARFLKTLDPMLINYMYQDKVFNVSGGGLSALGEAETPNSSVAAIKLTGAGVIKSVYSVDVGSTIQETNIGTWYSGTFKLPITSYYTRADDDPSTADPSTGSLYGESFGQENYFINSLSSTTYGWENPIGSAIYNFILTVGNNVGESISQTAQVIAFTGAGGGL